MGVVVEYEVTLERTEAVPVMVLKREISMPEIGDFVGEAFDTVRGALQFAGLEPAGLPIARYDIHDGRLDIEAGYPVPAGTMAPTGLMAGELPGTEVATTMHTGDYGEGRNAYQALTAWMQQVHYAPAGRPWEQYLDPPEVTQPRTIVRWPCRKF